MWANTAKLHRILGGERGPLWIYPTVMLENSLIVCPMDLSHPQKRSADTVWHIFGDKQKHVANICFF